MGILIIASNDELVVEFPEDLAREVVCFVEEVVVAGTDPCTRAVRPWNPLTGYVTGISSSSTERS
jgi:hypothetical protein